MIDISPASHDFLVVGIGSASRPRPFELTNTGTEAATFELKLAGVDRAQFSLVETTCTGTLEPAASCTVAVALRPDRDGALAADLRIVTGDAVLGSAALQGKGVVASVAIEPSLDSFGDVRIAGGAEHAFIVRNTSTAEIPAPVAALDGTAAYTVKATDCTAALAPGDTCSLTVRFAPTALGAQAATLMVGTATAQLGGTGAADLVVTSAGPGVITGPGIDCGASCSTLVKSSPIRLTSVLPSGARFAGWSGGAAGCGTAVNCDVAITSGMVSVGAAFADIPTVALTVINIDGGQGASSLGSVAIDPPNVTCGGLPGIETCRVDVLATTVTLTAFNECSKLRRWTGACAGAGLTCTIPLTADVSTTAEFELAVCQ